MWLCFLLNLVLHDYQLVLIHFMYVWQSYVYVDRYFAVDDVCWGHIRLDCHFGGLYSCRTGNYKGHNYGVVLFILYLFQYIFQDDNMYVIFLIVFKIIFWVKRIPMFTFLLIHLTSQKALWGKIIMCLLRKLL